jgi:Family of unknown function (DUF6188)
LEADAMTDLPLSGRKVIAATFNYVLDLTFSGGFILNVEAPFTISGREVRVYFDPDDFNSGELVKPIVSRLLGKAAKRASYTNVGDLYVEFDDGTILAVKSLAEYEAWNFVGPEGDRVVAMPGGEIARWSSAHDHE